MPVKSVEAYIKTHPKWEEELTELRKLFLSTELEETIKWDAPVYTIHGKNVVAMAAFKNHGALWFYQGALLKENTALLENTQDGKTKALRQIRFKKEKKLEIAVLRKYVIEAIQNQKEGKTIKPELNKSIEIPSKLAEALKGNPILKTAFGKLTPGKKREYAEYISEAKRETTKTKRLEKISPLILKGAGLHDKYKNC